MLRPSRCEIVRLVSKDNRSFHELPLGVRIVSLFSCACGVLLTFLGIAFLGVAGLSGLAGFPQTGVLSTVFGLVFIGLGVASFVSGLGLFRVSVWAWWLSFAAFGS